MKKLHFWILSISIVLLTMTALLKINGAPLSGDAPNNLDYAYHLSHHGVMATEQDGKILATHNREPLPIALMALWIQSTPALSNAENLRVLNQPQQLKLLKYSNVLWVAALLVGVVLLVRVATADFLTDQMLFISQLITLFLVATIFPIFNIVNNLLTELQAATLLIWLAWAAMLASKTPRVRHFVMVGVLLAALILTKAAFAYIGIGAFMLWSIRALQWKQKSLLTGGLIAFLVTISLVTPWIIRNYYQVGEWSLAGRGPIVLIVRAYKSNMTNAEFTGGFYAYGPQWLKPTLSHLTGFNAKDRELGGRRERFRRFHPQDEAARERGDEASAVGFYIKATTHANNIYQSYAKQHADPQLARKLAEQQIKNEAIERIKNNLTGHLKTSLLFAWRGTWPHNTVDGIEISRKIPGVTAWKNKNIASALGLMSVIGLFLIGLNHRYSHYFAISLFPVGMFSFHALLTHYIPRYSYPMIPIWLVCGVVVFSLMLHHFLLKFVKK